MAGGANQGASSCHGLISDEKQLYLVLTDIQGLEDHFGDMDFFQGCWNLVTGSSQPSNGYQDPRSLQKSDSAARQEMKKLVFASLMSSKQTHSIPSSRIGANQLKWAVRKLIPSRFDVDKIKIVIGKWWRISIRSSLKQALRLISTKKENVPIYSSLIKMRQPCQGNHCWFA